MKNIHIIEKHNGQILMVVHNGIAVGCVYRHGVVTNNYGIMQSKCPYNGLSKLLGVDEDEIRKAWPDIYQRRSKE